MGMYSFFGEEDIKVIDWKGLKDFIKLFNGIKKGSDWDEWFKDATEEMIDNQKKTITFVPWNDIKLISYWYAPYLLFLDGVAKYIEGRVDWEFETKDEAGYVTFDKGKCIIITGNMLWKEWKPKSALNKKDLTPEMEKLIVLTKL